MNTFRLENESVAVEIDAASGAIHSLRSKLTGWEIQRPVSDPLAFRMYAPLPGRRSNIITGTNLRPESIEARELTDPTTGNGPYPGLTIVWHRVTGNNSGELEITFTASICLTEIGLTFWGSVENRSDLTVESVSYPCLTGISVPDSGTKLYRMNQMTKSLSTTELYPRFPMGRGYWGTDRPSVGMMFERTPYILVGNEREGFYLAAHRRGDQPGVDHTFELLPGYRDFMRRTAVREAEINGRPVRIENRNVHLPFVEPGETKQLTPVALQPYAGDWHAGAEAYKRWRSTWFAIPQVPSWLREVHSWQQIHINSSEGELRCRYTELVEHAKQCVKHGVRAIQLTGWTMWGQDGYLPDHNIDPRLGTFEELKAAIAGIQAMGVKVVLYVKYQFADLTTQWYKDELHKLAIHDWWGNRGEFEGYSYQSPAQMVNATVHREAMMCMSAPRWRKLMHEQFRTCLALGADGVLNDEIQNFRAWHFCFDRTHDHEFPAYIDCGAYALSRELEQIASAERDAEEPFLLAGENHSDLLKLSHGLSYFRVFDGHVPAERYTDSEFPFMVSAVGFDDRESLNACLLYRYIVSYEPFHFRGKLDDFPLTIEYGKKVDELRRRYHEFLWEGTFRDVLGAAVRRSGENHPVRPYTHPILFSVFRAADDRIAVVLANHDEGAARLEVEVDEWSEREVNLVCASPESPQAVRCGRSVEVPARSALVIMEE